MGARALSLFDVAKAPTAMPYPHWVRVELVREDAVAYRTKIGEPPDLAAFVAPLIEREPREVFLIVCLDTKHQVNAVHRVGIGCVDQVTAHPREVFQAALLANAMVVALAHNHPSGDPAPSGQDVLLTQRLIDAGDILGVPVIDHLVIGCHSHVSIRKQHPEFGWGE